MVYLVTCEFCGETHEAEPAHTDRFSGRQLFGVTCPVDYMTDYYTSEVVYLANVCEA